MLGYYILFLLCQRIMNKKSFNSLDEMLDEYKVFGTIRIVLASFQDFGEIFNPEKYIRKVLSFFRIKHKNVKLYIKENKQRDTKIIMNALIVELGKEKCQGIDFKHIVENNFANKWGYFYHVQYISKIVSELNKICISKNLPAIGILLIDNNGKISTSYFDYAEKEGRVIPTEITKDSKITDKNVQNYINTQLKTKLQEYKKII